MAHRREIHAPLCDCGKKATVEVYDYRNTGYGPKCWPCGARLVKSLTEEERQRDAATEGENNG